MTERRVRLDSLGLLLLPIATAFVVFAPAYAPNPDAYYHFGVAELYAEHGWVRDFSWLPYTTLAHDFPNVYLGQHLLLLPWAMLARFTSGPDATWLAVGIWVMGLLQAGVFFAVLRRFRVPYAGLWVVLGIVCTPSALVHFWFLKGNATFVLLFAGVAEACWSNAPRRAFVWAWLSVYTYVGLPVLIGLAGAFVLARGLYGEGWSARLLLAVFGGIGAGLLVNPFWPNQLTHLVAEWGTVFARDDRLVPGELRGAEWIMLDGRLYLLLAALPLAAWAVVLIRQLASERRAPAPMIGGAIAALGLLAGSLLGGPKLLHLFAVSTILFLPPLVHHQGVGSSIARGLGAAAAIVAAIHSVSVTLDGVHAPDAGRPAEYAAMAEWLEDRTPADQVVVAPWDDFPGLFMSSRHNRYVAGMNPQFLRDADEKRFEAFFHLWRGNVQDPESLMMRAFDGAEYLLVRRLPRSPGEAMLTDRVAQRATFEELPSPVPRWRVFRRLSEGATP